MKLISPEQLLTDKGISFSNPHRITLENQGKFPRRVRLGAKKYAYPESEIDLWIEQRAAMREAS
jgi:predicted DNA-binding transcriptional regulator AlpA